MAAGPYCSREKFCLVLAASAVEAAAMASSAVEPTATAMELPATTVELAPATECLSTMESATTVAVSVATSNVTAETVIAACASVEAIMVPTACITAVPEIRRMSPVVPGSDAHKKAIYKVVRTIVAIRRTRIRIVIVIPIGADRRSRHISRPHANTDPDSNLRLRIGERHHQHR